MNNLYTYTIRACYADKIEKIYNVIAVDQQDAMVKTQNRFYQEHKDMPRGMLAAWVQSREPHIPQN